MNKENPPEVWAVFDSAYSLVPSDNIRITNNIEKGTQITSKLSSLVYEVKIMDDKLFSSFGEIKTWRGSLPISYLSNRLAKSPFYKQKYVILKTTLQNWKKNVPGSLRRSIPTLRPRRVTHSSFSINLHKILSLIHYLLNNVFFHLICSYYSNFLAFQPMSN